MNFDDFCATSRGPRKGVFVALFYGQSCAPCERLKPKLRQVCTELGLPLGEFASSAELVHLRLLGLRSVPAVVAVKDGCASVLFAGDRTAAEIEAVLKGAAQ